MGEPTYFDGPDYPDGTDAEGFPDGDQRFGVIKPSKEEVEAFRASVSEVDCIHNPATAAMIMQQKCLSLCDAYLALMEDYKEANVLLNGYDKLLTKLRDQRDKDQEEIRKFHADNEALREKLAQVEQASQRIIGNMIGEQQHGTY